MPRRSRGGVYPSLYPLVSPLEHALVVPSDNRSRRRRDSLSPLDIHVAAAAPPRLLVSTDYPPRFRPPRTIHRDSVLHGLTPSSTDYPPRLRPPRTIHRDSVKTGRSARRTYLVQRRPPRPRAFLLLVEDVVRDRDPRSGARLRAARFPAAPPNPTLGGVFPPLERSRTRRRSPRGRARRLQRRRGRALGRCRQDAPRSTRAVSVAA